MRLENCPLCWVSVGCEKLISQMEISFLWDFGGRFAGEKNEKGDEGKKKETGY